VNTKLVWTCIVTLLQGIQDQEFEVEITKVDVEKSRDKLAQAKLRLREQLRGGEGL